MDLRFLTVQHIMGSHFETECTIWLDAARIYPTVTLGLAGERSQVQIHDHPLPNVRCSKGQILEFRLNNLVLPSTACQVQTALFMIVAEYIQSDEVFKGEFWTPKEYVVETYITESPIEWLSRSLKQIGNELKSFLSRKL